MKYAKSKFYLGLQIIIYARRTNAEAIIASALIAIPTSVLSGITDFALLDVDVGDVEAVAVDETVKPVALFWIVYPEGRPVDKAPNKSSIITNAMKYRNGIRTH